MLTFLILCIIIIWCHSFTKLIGTEEKYIAASLLNFLLCFIYFYLLFYSSYIILRRLQTTWQMSSWTISSITPEEAWTTAILGSRHQCLHVFALDLYMDVMLCINFMHVMNIVMFEWMCIWIWMCIMWICVSFVIPAVLVILFSKKINLG
jgi:hypothetical protein